MTSSRSHSSCDSKVLLMEFSVIISWYYLFWCKVIFFRIWAYGCLSLYYFSTLIIVSDYSVGPDFVLFVISMGLFFSFLSVLSTFSAPKLIVFLFQRYWYILKVYITDIMATPKSWKLLKELWITIISKTSWNGVERYVKMHSLLASSCRQALNFTIC